MKQQKIHSTLKLKYDYNISVPEFQSLDGKYKTFKGVEKDLNIPVTIKVLLGPYQSQLVTYLNKLKGARAEQVVKFYEIIAEDSLAVITQQEKYGSLSKALLNCKKLDESDSIYISKYLLGGFMEILRSGVDWKGTANDIEITQGGLKLSWNNSMVIDSEQGGNNFKQLLVYLSKQQISQNQQRLLPFPQSKNMKELIRLTETSASEISLAPLMKKKQKFIKKKLKQYLLLRQTKSNFDYYEQIIYLGVHREHGFVKVKCYPMGNINPNILQLNKTKNTFTKVNDSFKDNNKFYMVSQYSNDGTLQNYVQRLKAASINLKQNQIQFFFYSLFEPLKIIQESTLKSLNMNLHIKNIYIESGIPKIGEPVPMNSQIQSKLIDRSDVPDFYHPGFKREPTKSDPTFDTYSLGVLLYKLMYTEYPIFPDNKVHIPTTPSYNSRLKKTLQIFLNEGGRLSQIQKRIQVSQDVLKQVKKNKQKLINAKKNIQKKNRLKKKKLHKHLEDQDIEIEGEYHQNNQKSKQQNISENDQDDEDEIMDDCFDCCVGIDVADHSIDPAVESLHLSPYRVYRYVTKLIVMLLIYILVLYLFYLQHNFEMLFQSSNLKNLNLTISTVNYEIITSSQTQFFLAFNQTSQTLPNLIGMGCMINNYNGGGDYSEMVSSGSAGWILYLLGGLLLFLTIIIMKSVLIFRYDYIKAKYNYQHGVTNYNYSNYLLVNLMLASLINHHFYYFNVIFFTALPSCLGSADNEMYSHTDYLFNHTNSEFLYIHTAGLVFYTVLTFLYFLKVYHTDTAKYSRLFNPILLITPFLLAYWIILRIGILNEYFHPSQFSALKDDQGIIKDYFKTIHYVGILGIVPEILFVVQFILNKFIDFIYWMFIDKRRRILIHQSSTENIQLNQQ